MNDMMHADTMLPLMPVDLGAAGLGLDAAATAGATTHSMLSGQPDTLNATQQQPASTPATATTVDGDDENFSDIMARLLADINRGLAAVTTGGAAPGAGSNMSQLTGSTGTLSSLTAGTSATAVSGLGLSDGMSGSGGV